MAVSKKHKKVSKTILIAGGVLLTALGFMIIPSLLKKCSNSLYKKTIKNEDIDFEDMEPEIIKKENAEEDNNGY